MYDLKRKDIENMHLILLAIRRVEKENHGNNALALEMQAQRLDTLHSALKTQVESVIEIQALDELRTDKGN